MKEEQNTGLTYIAGRRQIKNKTPEMTQSRTRCCLSHIINWSATNPAVVTRQRKLHQNKSGAKTVGKTYIYGVYIRQTNREESRQKEAGVEVACRGHHRQEGTSYTLYNTINCHARISHKHRRHWKLGLQLSLLHYI